jgi:hypothetical protein
MSETPTEITPLAESKFAILQGAEFGDVVETIDLADLPALREWFVCDPSVPNLAARAGSRATVPTGEPCRRCGGLMVRTGTCLTCQSCGESSGGCG